MKHTRKFSLALSSLATVLAALMLASCASDPQADAVALAAQEEKCVVIGSKLPTRRCNDAPTVSPGTMDPTVRALPTPSSGRP